MNETFNYKITNTLKTEMYKNKNNRQNMKGESNKITKRSTIDTQELLLFTVEYDVSCRLLIRGLYNAEVHFFYT